MLKVYWADVDYGRRGLRRETAVVLGPDELAQRMEGRGARLVDCGILWRPTLQRMTSTGFNGREMAQVYRSLGRRVEQGAKLEDAFRQAASFVSDPLLRVVLEDARSGVVSGLRIDEAMRSAGLPEEDAALISAMQDAGGTAEAFRGLGDSYSQRSTLRGKIMGVVIQPVVYTFLGLLMVWAAFIFLIPGFAGFFTQAGFKPPGFIQSIYTFDRLVVAHTLVSSLLYWSVVFCVMWFLGMSNFMRRTWRDAPILRDLLARSEAAQSLTAFALLYESAMRRAQAARRVAESCRGEQLKQAFLRLAGELEAGAGQAEAARHSDFPDFLAPTMIGALDANDPDATIEDLRIFARMLGEDVEVLAKRLETAGTVIFLLITALMVFGVFLVTIYPELAVVLSNA